MINVWWLIYTSRDKYEGILIRVPYTHWKEEVVYFTCCCFFFWKKSEDLNMGNQSNFHIHCCFSLKCDPPSVIRHISSSKMGKLINCDSLIPLTGILRYVHLKNSRLLSLSLSPLITQILFPQNIYQTTSRSYG